MKNLKEQYEFCCNEYVRLFSEKQDISFDYWIADEVGGIAVFIDQYFFNLSDIILDIETGQPKGLILKFQDDSVDYTCENKNNKPINYKAYTMGLRYEHLQNTLK